MKVTTFEPTTEKVIEEETHVEEATIAEETIDESPFAIEKSKGIDCNTPYLGAQSRINPIGIQGVRCLSDRRSQSCQRFFCR
jgi:hypothetical protein